MKISAKQISEATGFSPATVSNALNKKRGVNRNTAAAIFKAAKEMGYIPENRITKIKFVIYKRTGGIIDDTPFFNLLIDGVEKEGRRYGYEIVISHLDRFAEDYEEQVKWLIYDTSSAIILLGTELMEDDAAIFGGAKCPFLFFDYFDSTMGMDGVLINNIDSAKMAIQYLFDKGHRRIGYLRGDFRIQPFRGRAQGYQRALQKKNIPIDRRYTYTLGTTMEGAYKNMLEVLSKKPELPTAFFADNDMIALGAMKALKECGYRIPEDISMVGFDDLPFCEIASPRLTTIRISKLEMGAIAVRRMHELIQHIGSEKEKISICTEFIERDSVRDIRQ